MKKTILSQLAIVAGLLMALAIEPVQGQYGIMASRNIDYTGGANYADARDKLDILMPEGIENAPVILFFHGGALQEGDKRTGEILASTLVTHGIGVVSANYRLSPGVMHPAHLEDAAAAFAWTKRHIAEYGGDPNRVFVGGHSAGGYLAALISLDPTYLQAHSLGISEIRRPLPVSPFLYVEETAKDRPKTVWGREEKVWLQASVTPYIGPDKPPMLLIYADGDDPWRREQNERLKSQLSAAGSKISAVEIPNRTHGSIMSKMGESHDATMEEIAAFIKAH